MRPLLPGQRALIHILEVDTGESFVVHASDDVLFEAPNWSTDGNLYLNGDGALWRLPVEGGSPERVALDVPPLNNDHLLDPDGEHMFISTDDRQIYRVPLAGGSGQRLTPDDDGRWHFLHGVSPAGDELAYIGIDQPEDGSWPPGQIYLLPIGGEARPRAPR